MSKSLRVLMVEDSEDDALLVIRELERGGYVPIFERVETADAMTTALKKQEWDIILSDYSMPHFSVPEALKLYQQSGLELPFIVISGIIGEDTAVATMKAGAHDYLMKGNLKRLVPAIERELRDAEVRRQRRQVEEEFQKAEQNFRNSMDSSPLGILIITKEGELLYANQAILNIYGYRNIKELKAVPVIERYTPQSYAGYQEREEKRKLRKPIPPDFEISIVRRDGEIRHLAVFHKEVLWDSQKQFQTLYLDITESKKLEEKILSERNEFNSILQKLPIGVSVLDSEDKMVYFNHMTMKIDRYKENTENLIGKDVRSMHPERIQTTIEELLNDFKSGKKSYFSIEAKRGKRSVEISYYAIRNAKGEYQGLTRLISDVTERKLAEKDLKKSHDRLRSLAARIEDLREAERVRVAREIHDDLGQALLTLNADIFWLKKKIPTDQVVQQEKIDAILATIKTTLQSVRRISRDLRPSMLESLGLMASIEWFIQDLKNRTGLSCKLYLPSDNLRLDEKLAITIFRIVQEALTNVVRHAEATRIEVKFEKKGGRIKLVIQDDGKGITMAQIEAPDSLGLMGMRERVYPWGGEVKVEGHRGKGTTVSVIIPDVDMVGAA